MSEEDVRTEICEALTKEITALRQSAESLYFAFDRVFNFGFVFVLGVVGLSLTHSDERRTYLCRISSDCTRINIHEPERGRIEPGGPQEVSRRETERATRL